MRMLHQEFVECFDYDQLDFRHVDGLELAIKTSLAFVRINDFKPEVATLLMAAKDAGSSGESLVPGLELTIEWFEHSSRIAILRDELDIILKIAKGRPEPVSSTSDEPLRDPCE